MRDSHSSDREGALFESSHSQSSNFLLPPTDDDAGLLALEAQFNELAAELVASQNVSDATGLESGLPVHGSEGGQDVKMRKVEAILARLDPIERAIMATPARTIAGLGVKARHAAYVMSHYWEAPIDRIDWDARAVRLLIEAVCDFTHTPLPFQN
ncbi:MAG: hypothetical protein WA418_12295 [Bradyrhizobium sp.]